MRLLFTAVTALLFISFTAASTVPLILWSSFPYFSSHSVLSSEDAMTSAATLNGFVQSLLAPQFSTDVLSVLSNSQSSPELVIAFLLPEFSAAELSYALGGFSDEQSSDSDSAYAFMKDTLAHSSSSLTVLHSMPLYSENELINIVQNAEPRARTITASCDNAISELNRQKSLSSNGHSDLLVVSITSVAEAAQCVKSVLSAADSENTNYVAMISAKQPHALRRNFGSNVNAPLSATAFVAHAQSAYAHSAESSFRVQAASSPYSPTSDPSYGPQKHPDFPNSYVKGSTYLRPGPLYINPSITIGLIVGLFLVVTLFIGLSCITDIERPVRMTNTPIQIPKEY